MSGMKKNGLYKIGKPKVQIVLTILYLVILILYGIFAHTGFLNEKLEAYFHSMVFTTISCFAICFVIGTNRQKSFLSPKIFNYICIMLEIYCGIVTITEGFYYFVEGYTPYALMSPVVGMFVAYIRRT